MRSPSRWATNLPRKTRDIALAGAFGALLFVAQVALSFLPNIELVSILVIVYTLVFQGQVIWTLGVFILLEGLVYGFGTWWVSYLYLWPALAGLTWLFRNMQSSLGWAILAAAYGLGFGALTGGWTAGLSYWVSGIPFDLAHCGGNFVAALALYRPLRGALTRLQTALLA